ncbi:MAG: peptide chain release factor N(5)-glutamine methyltransferase [Eubacterium sp.]|nr:peptide chain release factor N(5)-glutamine methyltransferase [Eubacterium sp.]
MTAAGFLSMVRERLSAAGIEEAAAESWILLEWIFGLDRASYYMDPQFVLPEEKMKEAEEVLLKRERRVPLQYLMGICEFMGLTFHVDERVLIPRQDTECLVELALSIMEHEKKEREPGRKPQVLDLCTGSGCIGISIGKLFKGSEITLSDISGDALSVAGMNAENLGVAVDQVRSDLFDELGGSFDYILSNPPYIPSAVIDTLMPEVRDHEPRPALDGKEDGLAFYRRIVHEAKEHLYPGGWLLLEIGMDQGMSLLDLLEKEGYIQTGIKKDLAGLDRIAVGRKK